MLAPARARFSGGKKKFRDQLRHLTPLDRRLQGEPFKDDYLQSEEISVAAIQWKSAANDNSDIVKVEIWDVVSRTSWGQSRSVL